MKIKKIAILSFPDGSGHTGYCAVYAGYLREDPDRPYLFYVETISNDYARQDVIMWSNRDQRFELDGGQ